ncbi:unnamed protein product [Caenorhabditis sp. 36 PRJEB53466]|nr:unnamed protein product [Caenorhabditis sp. 36 PRJEB53466]
MSRRIDHDEDGRDSSEYEEMDDEEEEVEEPEKEHVVYVKSQFEPEEYIEEQEPSTSQHNQMEEETVPINIEYEEVYPHNTVQVVHPHEMVEAEKNYYENEMEDLVYHEIYGEGSDQQKLEVGKRIRDSVGTNATCLVCQRSESEKIRLFKWPKSEDLREQWLHFFRMPTSVFHSMPEPYICCYHFSADTFVMMDDRIFWKMTAVPKYRQRRPGLAEPFPWEPAAKLKLDQPMINRANTTESFGFKIRYRLPYNKHKNRNVHQVAVMIPIAQPHLYYEFHFNRYGLRNTKFYACLNCRKAKAESGIRDVIRTIHLDGNKFLSNGDPFNGHHFACRPHNIYDCKSSWRPMPGQTTENHFLDDIVYVDERGNSLEWDTVTRPADEAITKFEDTERKEEEAQMEMYAATFDDPMYEEVIRTVDDPPVLDMEYPQEETVVETKPVKLIRKQSRIKCHLCLKNGFSSTHGLVEHLQKHIAEEKNCKRCSKRISCDSRTICIRRGVCESCYTT